MSVSPSFRAFAIEQLGMVARDIRAKNMFGGVGVYSQDRFFALLADDELYLKVDDTNRPDFEALGIGPFRPFGPDGEAMQYYPLPGDLLEDADALRSWVEKAIAVATNKQKRKKPPRA
jgi:DNA transformation protein and related proteins